MNDNESMIIIDRRWDSALRGKSGPLSGLSSAGGTAPRSRYGMAAALFRDRRKIQIHRITNFHLHSDEKFLENVDIIEENFKDKKAVKPRKEETLENKMPTENEDSTVKCEPMNGKLKEHFWT